MKAIQQKIYIVTRFGLAVWSRGQRWKENGQLSATGRLVSGAVSLRVRSEYKMRRSRRRAFYRATGSNATGTVGGVRALP